MVLECQRTARCPVAGVPRENAGTADMAARGDAGDEEKGHLGTGLLARTVATTMTAATTAPGRPLAPATGRLPGAQGGTW